MCEHTTTHSEDKKSFVRVHSSSVAKDAHNATVCSDCLADLENLTYIKLYKESALNSVMLLISDDHRYSGILITAVSGYLYCDMECLRAMCSI